MPLIPRAVAPALPVPVVAALAAAALLAVVLPGGRWSDALALLAAIAALSAAQERRTRAMIVAAGIAAGLAPAGALLAPLCLGLAIRRGAARHLPLALLAAAIVALALPWATPVPTLPNLATLAMARPDTLAPVAAFGIGIAAWLGARASAPLPGPFAPGPLAPGAVIAEARLGAILLACVLPLPIGVLGVVLTLAALPLPARPRLQAANDNVVHRRTVRLAA